MNFWIGATVVIALIIGGVVYINLTSPPEKPLTRASSISSLSAPSINSSSTPSTQGVAQLTALGKDDIVVGVGSSVQSGQTVTVHYTGKLTDGTVFDSSIGRDPVTFPLSGVIQGWQDGIPGMKVGGKRKLSIPAAMGYGANSPTPSIPANSDLYFDVELLAIK